MRKAIAIDFDGCLCTDEYPAIGKPNQAVIDRARREQEGGAGLILWTCREGQLLQEAVNACREWGLTFDSINESLPDWIEEFGTHPRKVGASEYWDDRAVHMAAVPVPNDPPPNAPLTLDELREMEGEPIWIRFIHTRSKSCYRIIRSISNTAIIFQEYSEDLNRYYSLFLGFYGMDWLAYRRKPED